MALLSLLSPEARAELAQFIDERLAEHLGSIVPVPPLSSPWLTVKEAADYLRTSRDAVYKRIKRGKLPSHRPEGSQILLRKDDLDEAGPRQAVVL